MKISSRWMFLPALGCAIFAAACATDVPFPDDPDAQTWGPELKSANKNWQPPEEMSAGNPEYLNALKAGAEPAKNAAKKTEGIVEADEILLKGFKDDDLASLSEKENASSLADPLANISISADQKFKFNGEDVAEPDLKLFLKDFASNNKVGEAEITYDVSQSDKAGEIALYCKKNGFTFVTMKSTGGSADKKAAKVPAFEIDRTVPAKEYTVVKGDSLSRIAQKEYKNGNYWFVLYQENKEVLKNADKLKPGMKIKVPVLKTAKNVK